MTRPITRIEPKGLPQDYKSYQILAPQSTHFETITCEQADCEAYQHGWITKIDEGTDLGKQQGYYIRNVGGRHYKEERYGPFTTFTFSEGQRCFRQHQRRIPRPELFIVKDGDWRDSTNLRRHANADDWVDDFKTHQDKIATQIERG